MLDGGLILQNLRRQLGQGFQLTQQRGIFLRRKRALDAAQLQRHHIKAHDLRAVALGSRHGDLHSGLGIHGGIRLPGDAAALDVGDRHHLLPMALSFPQSRDGIRRLA